MNEIADTKIKDGSSKVDVAFSFAMSSLYFFCFGLYKNAQTCPTNIAKISSREQKPNGMENEEQQKNLM